MFDEADRGWTIRSIDVRSPKVEVRFVTKDRFFTGHDNPIEIADPANYVPLPRPGTGDSVSIAELAGDVKPLARYYREVVTRSKALGRSFPSFCNYFWMRLGVVWEGGGVSFPWYDTWGDMEGLLGWLDGAADGDGWFDLHQGWELQVARMDSSFFLREGNGQGVEGANVRMDRDALLEEVSIARNDVTGTIEELTGYLGKDVWSKRTGWRKIAFKTATWGAL